MNKTLQVLRDCVVGVVEGLYTGLYVYGPPGSSKSYTILETLNARGANYTVAEGESASTTPWSGGYGKLKHQAR
jgi:hypothetical protein